MMDGAAALALVKSIGIRGLGELDGCVCSNFEVKGVSVDISCRKSPHGIMIIKPDFNGIQVRVYSRHLDSSGPELEAIAREVASQLMNDGNAIIARYCDSSYDHNMRCIYCEHSRTDQMGYLCKKCLAGKNACDQSIAELHDLRRHDFIIPAEPYR